MPVGGVNHFVNKDPSPVLLIGVFTYDGAATQKT